MAEVTPHAQVSNEYNFYFNYNSIKLIRMLIRKFLKGNKMIP